VNAVLRDLKEKGHLGPEQFELIISRTSSLNANMRETAWHSLRLLLPPRTERLGKAALTALKEDSDPYVRELALEVLINFEPKPAYMDALYESMNSDKDAVVQVCACKTLAGISRQDPRELQPKALAAVTAFFRQYGAKCERADKDWGWRVVGNTLRDVFGKEGREALEQIMQQKEDQHLADLAWRVVYLRQDDEFHFMTEEEERQAHLKHPFLKFDASPKNN
jgi:HEAT repeats